MYHNTATTLTVCILTVSTVCLVLFTTVAPITWSLSYAALITTLSAFGVHKWYE